MTAPTIAVTCVANDQNGNPVAGAVFTARLDSTEVYQGFVVPERVQVVANASGIAVLNLWPNALGVAGSLYRVTAVNPDTGRKFLDTTISVPNSPCNLHEILVQAPYPTLDAAAQTLVAAQGALAAATATLVSEDNTAASAAAALTSQSASAGSATAAAGSATAASAAQVAASASATAAATSATSAGNSQTAAAASATSALGSATTATTKAGESLASANASETSKLASGVSAAAAAASELASANSAATATGQASVATTKAAEALASATSAAGSAGSASASQTAAAASAGQAAASATTAGLEADEATAQQVIASAKATDASGSATAALASQTAAAASATAAGNSETAAATSATTASTGATTATTQAGIATTKAAEAAAQASLASGYAASVAQQDLSGATATALHRSPNAVTAMFVYDTGKDSDGGAWTEKCQHTSWYNEAINGKWLGAQASELNARYEGSTLGVDIANGGFDTDTAWTKGSGWTISNGAARVPSGASSSITQINPTTLSVGDVVKVTFTISAIATGRVYILIAGNLTNNNTEDFAVSGTYTRFVTVSGVTDQTVGLTVGNSPTGIVIDNVSIRKVTALNTQSGDYFQRTTDGKFYRLWKNLLARTQDFENNYWPASIAGKPRNTAVSSNSTTDPNGNLTADKLVASTTDGQHFLGANNFAVFGIFTGSIYVKAAEYTKCILSLRSGGPFLTNANAFATFDLAAGTVVSNGTCVSTITAVGDGWFRISVSQAISDLRDLVVLLVDNAGNSSFAGDGSSGIFIWGAQLEYGSTATTYEAKTTDGSVTETFRGNKRDFPRLSAIVAEASNVTVYDLTEPGRPMWMRFVNGGTSWFNCNALYQASEIKSICALNSNVCVGASDVGGGGLNELLFTKDMTQKRHSNPLYGGIYSFPVAKRNAGNGAMPGMALSGLSGVVSHQVNAVAMTVLPDAPVDPVTGLKVPTIAVATGGGVSVIKHDGVVRNSSSTTAYTKVVLDEREVGATYASGFSVSGPPGALGASFVLTNYTTASVPALMGVPTAVA